jgi:hypothetical protein
MANPDDARLEKLYKDRGLAKLFVAIIDQVVEKDDPRRAGAMEHYKAKLAEIDEKITAIQGTPPPVTVQLKTARLTGNSQLGA